MKKIYISIVILVLTTMALIGCRKEIIKPDVPTSATSATLPPPKSERSTIGVTGIRQAPIEQLHSAMLDLESFRVFGYLAKLQGDKEMLASLKGPTFEYIRKNIDPHLKLKKIIYDPQYAYYIASFLYLKAYLYWIHDDSESAMKTIAVLNRTFPQKHSDITIYHFDKGNIQLNDALYELEGLIRSSAKP